MLFASTASLAKENKILKGRICETESFERVLQNFGLSIQGILNFEKKGNL